MNDLESMRMLASRLADGTATRDDASRLSALLRESPDLREAYASFMETHAALCWHFRDQAEVPPPPRPTPVVHSSVANTWLPWFVTMVAVLVAVVAHRRPESGPATVNPTTIAVAPPIAASQGAKSDKPYVALLVDEAGARFAAGRGPDGLRFGPGAYELQAGVVHLRFVHGAEVVLMGATRLEIDDASQVRLSEGMVRVVAPPSAAGFTIATPAVDYVDLGTEFGLRVEPQSGTTDLYVFDGQVNVADPESGKVLTEVFGGTGTRYVQGVPVAAPELNQDDFPNPSAIGLVRWRAFERRMATEPGVLAFFPFQRGNSDLVLGNAKGIVPDGRIHGARWASGRWPGKDALLFDRDEDYVELTIPGEYTHFSLAAWAKVDRLDFELNAVFNSSETMPGGIHFQFTRQGLLRGGVVGVKSADTVVGDAVPIGRWVHVALVVAAEQHDQRIYINGKLVRIRALLGDAVVRPGTVRLGNWVARSGVFPSDRAFRGRLDELSIWNRALSEAEIVRLVEEGQPSMPYSEQFQAIVATP